MVILFKMGGFCWLWFVVCGGVGYDSCLMYSVGLSDYFKKW